jgi:Type II secretory pathway, component PulK
MSRRAAVRPARRCSDLRLRALGRWWRRTTEAAGQRGFALVAVLWVLLLLSMLAVSYGLASRTSLALARNVVGRAEAEALADAGVHRVMAGLVATTAVPFYRIDGTPYRWAFGNGEVRFSVEDESGKIDINTASPKLLAALFQVVGMRPRDAEALADAVDAYRNRLTDEANANQGAPADDTRVDEDVEAAGAPVVDQSAHATSEPQRSMAFALVEELLRVPGVTGDLYRRIAPVVTVFTGADTPDETTALPEAALAVSLSRSGSTGGGAGAKQAELRARLEQRRSSLGEAVRGREQGSLGGGAASAGTPRSLLGDADSEPTSGNGTLLIHSEAMTVGGSVFVREAVVRLSLEQSPPYVVLAWRQGTRWLFPVDQPGAG